MEIRLGKKSGLFLMAAVLLCAWLPRILLGVDFTDEAFPLAVAKHLSLGANLFADEIDMHQTTAPYLYPFFLIFSLFEPDLSGLFFCMRLLPLLFMGLTCLRFIQKQKTEHGSLTSVLLVFPLLVYAPGPSHGLIYSVGAYLAWSALLLTDLRNFGEKNTCSLILTGALAGMLTGFYLTPVVVFLLTALILAASKKATATQLFWACTGYALGLLPVFYFLLNANSLSHLADALQTNSQLHYPFFTASKFNRFVFNSQLHLWQLLLLPAGWLLSRKARQWREAAVLAFFILLSLYFCFTGEPAEFQSDRLLLGTGFLIVGVALGDAAIRSRIGLLTWLLTAAVGVTTAYTTNARGILTFAWVLAPLGVLIFTELIRDCTGMGRKKYLILLSLAVLSLGLWFSHAKYNYDSVLDPQLQMVKSGPFRLLWANQNKVAYLHSATDTLAAIPAETRLFIYYNFPAGYLISQARPWSNFLWAFYDFNDNPKMNAKILGHFELHANWPDYVVEMKYLLGKRSPKIPYMVTPGAANEIQQSLKKKSYRILKETDVLRLYQSSEVVQ